MRLVPRSRRSSRTTAALGKCALVVAATLTTTIAKADTNATWTAESSGDWTNTLMWSTSPNYPDNGTPLGTNYDATINATGGTPYVITIDSIVTIDSMTINSSDATVNLTAGSLTTGTINVSSGGTFNWTGGSLNINGGLSVGPGGTLGSNANPSSALYNITQIGLTDSVHTNTDGYSSASPQYMNSIGQTTGESGRFKGEASNGQDSWIYSPSSNSTQLIGLDDSQHVQTGGYADNTLVDMNAAGQVTGEANRYNGATALGQDAWFYSWSTNSTQIIGLTDAAHTQSNGSVDNIAARMSDAGQVLGYAQRYSGNTNIGRDTWYYSPSTNTTQIIGLTDSAHTRSDGYSFNAPVTLNSAGQAIGYADTYLGTTTIGQDAWLYSPSTNTTQIIGLNDATHSKLNDVVNNMPDWINSTGQVVGTADRYTSTGVGNGQDAWLYSPSTKTTQIIGLTDPTHLSSTGYANSAVGIITSTGYAIGWSQRTPGNLNLGEDAWLYSSTTNTTKLIGLTDAAHTESNGYGYNTPSDVSDNGYVAGNANRYSGTTSLGQDSWVYSPSTNSTKLIGLTDSAHTESNGFSNNQTIGVDSLGDAFGFAYRYTNDSMNGLDSWYYDAATGTTQEFVSSPSASGYSYSQIDETDGNTVLGYYYVNGNSSNVEAFMWSQATGVRDLGSLVQGGLSAAGWTALTDGLAWPNTPDITGTGDRPNANAAFEMTPVPDVVVNSGMALNSSSTVNVLAGGAMALAGGSITTPQLVVQPTGAFTWSSGTLNITGSGSSFGGMLIVPNAGLLKLDGAVTDPVVVSPGGTFDLDANTSSGILVRTLSTITILPNTGSNPNGQINALAASSHANRQLVVTAGLSIGGSSNTRQGQFDLANNDMILHGGNLATLVNQIHQGFNNGTWTGQGITSSSAATTTGTALGIESNSDGHGNVLMSSFDGQPVSATDVLVKYTFFGDANLDGVVNSADYTVIDNGLNFGLSGWQNGDFNYDGVINGDDYTLIDNAFNSQGSVSFAADLAEQGGPAEMIAADTAQIATPAVPEPTISLVGLSAIAMLQRRSRRVSPRR